MLVGTNSAFGSVLLATVTPAVLGLLRTLKKPQYFKGLPKIGSQVAIKLVSPRGKRSDKPLATAARAQFLENNMREAVIQGELATSKCKMFGGRRFCAAKYVPKVYFAGWSPTMGAFVTVMEKVEGTSLKSMESRREFPRQAYQRLEEAVISLWLNGILHNDLHVGNVLYDRKTGRVTIIDFGAAVYVYGHRSLQHLIPRMRSFVRLWPEVPLKNRDRSGRRNNYLLDVVDGRDNYDVISQVLGNSYEPVNNVLSLQNISGNVVA